MSYDPTFLKKAPDGRWITFSEQYPDMDLSFLSQHRIVERHTAKGAFGLIAEEVYGIEGGSTIDDEEVATCSCGWREKAWIHEEACRCHGGKKTLTLDAKIQLHMERTRGA